VPPPVYLNCPACHLSLRTEFGPREECPRCRKRDDLRVPMFRSPLPYRLLAGPMLERR
jgi:hypothetical protein